MQQFAPWVKEHGLKEPYGKCQCGCGDDVALARGSNKKLGYLRGHPVMYIHGHKSMVNRTIIPPLPDGSRAIQLTKGYVAIVDAEDYEWLSQWLWFASVRGKRVYAVRVERGTSLFMHRVIVNAPDNLLVDHEDRDTLNNRRRNLRMATKQQNNCNSHRGGEYTSKYKGVHWHKDTGKWAADIRSNRKSKHLGLFTDEVAAAKAYDRAAIEKHGDFAFLNFGGSNEHGS